jgi:hypothetical protein
VNFLSPLDLVRMLARREGTIPAHEYPDDPNAGTSPDVRPAFEPPIEIPKNRAEVIRVFGNPGTGKVAPKWERANLVIAKDLPGDWNNGKGRLYCHRLAEPFIREALHRCEDAGCLDYITRLGCFNFRHQRHDPRRPLSYHSWGIAIDIDPARNGAKTLTERVAPWSPKWMALWPDAVPEALVAAFEGIGWSWGGRWCDRDGGGYGDPMHMELVA